MFGDSADGSASLLIIQSLLKQNISLPSCIWCDSPWCNLSQNDK